MLEVHVQPLASLRASSALCAQWKVPYSTGPLHMLGKCSMTEATAPGPCPVFSWNSSIKTSCPVLVIHSFIHSFQTLRSHGFCDDDHCSYCLNVTSLDFLKVLKFTNKIFSENYKLSVWPIPETA